MYSFLYLCKNIYIGRTSCDDKTYSDPLEVWKDDSFFHKYFCSSCWLSAHLLPSIVFIPLTLLISMYYSFLCILSCLKPWVLQWGAKHLFAFIMQDYIIWLFKCFTVIHKYYKDILVPLFIRLMLWYLSPILMKQNNKLVY